MRPREGLANLTLRLSPTYSKCTRACSKRRAYNLVLLFPKSGSENEDLNKLTLRNEMRPNYILHPRQL